LGRIKVNRLTSRSDYRLQTSLFHSIVLFTCALFVSSILKLIPGELGDYIYGSLVLLLTLLIAISARFQKIVNRVINGLFKSKNLKVSILVFLATCEICFLFPTLKANFEVATNSPNWLEGLVSFSAASTLLILICNLGLLRLLAYQRALQYLLEFVGKYYKVIFAVFFGLFALRTIKTPYSLPDFFHTVFAGDELLSSTAGLSSYQEYVGQYSNAISIFVGFIPIEIANKRLFIDWILIALQVLNLLIIYLALRKINNRKLSYIFGMIIFASPFFGGSSAVDWLQNTPARTIFLTLSILFIVHFIFFPNRKFWFLILILVSLTLFNDLLTGLQLSLSLIAFYIFTFKKTKFWLRILYSSVLFTLCILPLVYNFITSPIPFELITTHFRSYGESGFAHEFNILGPDVVFWGFALGCLHYALQHLGENTKSKNPHLNLMVLLSFLVLSTIPYSVGRSFSAQIWASSAIYIVLLFSVSLKFIQMKSEMSESDPKVSSINSVYGTLWALLLPIVISMNTGFWSPIGAKMELVRILQGTNNPGDYFASEIDGFKYALDLEKTVLSARSRFLESEIAFLVPRGNLLSIEYGIQNKLVVNHPDSLILSSQVDALCRTFEKSSIRAFVTDFDLATRIKDSPECQKFFVRWSIPEQSTTRVLLLYAKTKQ